MTASHARARGIALGFLGVFAGSFMACHDNDGDSRLGSEAVTRGEAAAALPGGARCADAPAIGDAANCTAPLVPGADRRCTLQVGRRTREVLIHSPPSFA